MKTSFLSESTLPLVIEPEVENATCEDLIAWIAENREMVNKNLLHYGGILLRNFDVQGATDFNKVVEALDLGEQLNYVGGDSPRDKVQDKVYTSTEAPRSMKIPLHQEMSFIKDFPKHIYFHCDIPAKEGGATIIADARKILKDVDGQVRDKFEKKELKYVSNYYGRSVLLDMINKLQRGHKTWMEVFETKEKKNVEKACKEESFEYVWRKNDWLSVAQKSPAVLKHPKTKEEVWFNQAHLYDFNPRLIGFWNWVGTKFVYMRKHTVLHEIFYQDGSKIEKDELYHVMDVLDKHTVSFPWQKGDVMILDNILAMHGRAAFSGKRRILTALTR